MSTVEFNMKFDKLASFLHVFAYNLTKNTEEAKDLFQDTAFRALINRDKFQPDTNFKAWLFTIMKNIFINNYRKKVKANTVFDSSDNQFLLNSGSQQVLNLAASSMTFDELSAMVDSLDENVRVPFLLHYEGFKYQEIADDLGLPLGTIKSRIFFARKELKEQITRNYGMEFVRRYEKSDLEPSMN